MQTKSFTYSFFSRMVYRYGILPANLLLLFYVLPFMFHFAIMKYFYGGLLAVLLYILNSYFFYLVKIVPYCIEIRGNTMRCSKFFLSSKVIEFPMDKIQEIRGGIFDKKPNSMYKIEVRGIRHELAFFRMIRGCKELQNILLQGVDKELYDELIARLGIDKSK